MRQRNALITLCKQEVAPRFDMTAEVLVITWSDKAPLNQETMPADHPTPLEVESKHLILAHTSSKELCDLIISMDIKVVVCGGIEEDYYHYLRWKRVDVINNVMGNIKDVVQSLVQENLQAGACLYPRDKQDE